MVGCGYFGRIQIEAWQRIPEAEISAACDLDEAKVGEFGGEFGIRAYSDLARMLDEEKPDFVDVVTRPFTHLDLVKRIGARGLPILLQKPLAVNWTDAQAVVAAAQDAGVRMMVNENWRRQRWYREIAALIAAGRIGDPFYYSMQARSRDGLGPVPYARQPYFKDMPRLIIFEMLVHHLDTARFLFGPIEEVYCRTAKLNPIIAGEDVALIQTEHASGLRGVIDGNRATEPEEPGQGMETTQIDGFEGKIRLGPAGRVRLNGEVVFDGSDLPGYKGDSCFATQRHFVECLESGEEFETEAADYMNKTFAVVEACYRSAAEHRPVRVDEITGGGG